MEKENVVVPAHINSTQLRPDLALWSNLEKVVSFIEFFGRTELRKLDIQR